MTGPKRANPAAALPERDKPWLFRTYAGHSTAAKSNALYRKNLAKGQTGLSIAFDLPTQTGYDADHELARGEIGKVGVPVSHLGDMLDDHQCHGGVAAGALYRGRRRAGHR
jgi:(2R)-ethylmalonyl-CoA mutase